ncbi:MAG: histidine triad nucleotide-binding protein [Cyanobacteria bacterium SIG29]|nr:histidine triad nucleotide-binding protein [Cyanobacteria bacterium SIG29]
MSLDCIFCKIANKEINTNLIYEDENVVAFNDLNPQAPTHFLVIPKKHYASLNEINEKGEFENIFSAVPKVCAKLGIKEYRTVVNTGASAGQTVFHIHVHVMAGREFGWPAG